MINRSSSINFSIYSDNTRPTLTCVGCSRNLLAGVGSVTFTFFRARSWSLFSYFSVDVLKPTEWVHWTCLPDSLAKKFTYCIIPRVGSIKLNPRLSIINYIGRLDRCAEVVRRVNFWYTYNDTNELISGASGFSVLEITVDVSNH